MKRHIVLVIIVLLIGLFIAFSAAAYPWAEPPDDASLTFINQKTEVGDLFYQYPGSWSGHSADCYGN